MKSPMKRWLAAAAMMTLTSAMLAAAQEAALISTAQLQKILKSVDTIGAKENFPAPTAQNLGLSSDPSQHLPVLSVTTDDHMVYFCRSQLNPDDYIIWAHAPGKTTSSYMFSTHSDFKLNRALYLRDNEFPEASDINSPQIKTIYKNALTALAKDVDRTSP